MLKTNSVVYWRRATLNLLSTHTHCLITHPCEAWVVSSLNAVFVLTKHYKTIWRYVAATTAIKPTSPSRVLEWCLRYVNVNMGRQTHSCVHWFLLIIPTITHQMFLRVLESWSVMEVNGLTRTVAVLPLCTATDIFCRRNSGLWGSPVGLWKCLPLSLLKFTAASPNTQMSSPPLYWLTLATKTASPALECGWIVLNSGMWNLLQSHWWCV